MRQLTSLDAQFLAMEGGGTYGHVGALALFDPSTAPGGNVTSDDLARVIGGRIDQLPPFHQRLVWVPFGLDHPYWIEDPNFDLGFHIRDTAVPPPGDDKQLAETVARIFARPLDRRRPLWELYLIHGIEGGKVGMLTKVHHAAVDGVSGAEIIGVLFDLEADVPSEEPGKGDAVGARAAARPGRDARPRPARPGPAAGARDALAARRGDRAARHAGRGDDARRPAAAARAAPRSQKALGDAPRHASWSTCARRARRRRASTGRSAPHRRFSFGSLPLDDVKALKSELGIKVNDVVVALVAGGVRDWLLERGELPDEPLVALVPVSVRTDEEKGTFGNKVTGMVLPIPTDVADPRERLLRAHEILKRAKGQTQGLPASLMTDVSNFLPPAIYSRAARLALEVTGRVRPALNLVISNVPGPPVPLYCAGARMLAHHPVSVITDGVGLNITVMSYEDRLDFGIVVDRDMVDEAWSFMDAMSDQLETLKEAILPASAARSRPRRPRPSARRRPRAGRPASRRGPPRSPSGRVASSGASSSRFGPEGALGAGGLERVAAAAGAGEDILRRAVVRRPGSGAAAARGEG